MSKERLVKQKAETCGLGNRAPVSVHVFMPTGDVNDSIRNVLENMLIKHFSSRFGIRNAAY